MSENISSKKFWQKIILGFFLVLILGGFFILPTLEVLAEGEDESTVGKSINLGAGMEAVYRAQVLAEAACATMPSTPAVPNPPCPTRTIKTITASIIQKLSPLLKAAAINLVVSTSQYVLDTLAYQAAVWVASGGEGESPLFNSASPEQAWEIFGKNVAANAIGSLSTSMNDYLDTDFNLCQPTNPLFRFGLQIGLKSFYKPPQPICTWQQISGNWEGWVQTMSETTENPSEAILSAVAEGFRPGQNTLSYFAEVNIRVKQKSLESKNALFAQFIQDSGFQPVADIVTGSSETPASFVSEHLKTQIEQAQEHNWKASQEAAFSATDILPMILTHTTSVFVNTLLSTWISKIGTGLFDTDPIGDVDLDNYLTSGTNNYGEAAEQYYADVISTVPTAIDNYSALSEFIICPGADSRQTNNCVMDTALATAISKSGPTDLLTVSRALEQGALNGDWPLYSSDNLSKNQDTNCYTYGYCAGNLVKMRKARIISVGWEMAANSTQNSGTNPVTLQEVVDGFNYCNSDGQLDSEHPWCHLIDPNWVLKYPTQQCDASMVTNQTISTSSPSRAGACVDATSCVVENDDGSCGGYGYCTREKNTWNFSGDSCPEEFATCLTFTNTETSDSNSWLFNSLDQGLCNSANAGCLWYRTNKHLDNAGTTDDTTDDSYEWLPGDDLYLTAERENDALSYDSAGKVSDRTDYYYDTNGDGAKENSYSTFTFEDRIYFNSQVAECTVESAGCNELYEIANNLSLNVLRNPGFEDNDIDNNAADYWTTSGTGVEYYTSETNAYNSDSSYYLTLDGRDSISQNNIILQPGTFYNMSLYVKGEKNSAEGKMVINLVSKDNLSLDITGLSTDCEEESSGPKLYFDDLEVSDFKSFDCTFTTPLLDDSSDYVVADLTITAVDGAFYIDAIQLEARSAPTTFHEGYNQSAAAVYFKIPPSWLGCTGESTDPADCGNYAAVCSATESGCSLYTPTNGDPGVPAVLADKDQCPEECVGYSAYKQEDTAYDTGEFPLYFIADKAMACSSSEVGCDEYVNLTNEETESFSYLRACATSEMAGTSNDQVFFTWEGSDNSGYQLVSYQLLKSNLTTGSVEYNEDSDSDGKIDSDLVNDVHAADAPCTSWQVSSSGLVCAEDSDYLDDELAEADDCNEHGDIFINPDCREFYDTSGNAHYRLYSETISITDDCTAYRKVDSDSFDCTNSGGYWNDASGCRYLVAASESTSCSAPGCREYTGGGSRNASAIFTEYFEDGNYDNFENSYGSEASLSISNESVAVDGHSLRVTTTKKTDGIVTQHDFTIDQEVCNEASGCTSENKECIVNEGEVGCGVLNEYLVNGKTYVLEFWAKGTGSLSVSMADNAEEDDSYSFGEDNEVALTSAWRLYELGPFDTSKLDDPLFDGDAVLRFTASSAGQVFYLDNIELKQTEEDLTLIKDSWITPSTCDETSDGAVAEQYYLGCEEYTDQNDEAFYIYQFTSLCSEAAVGCTAYYGTQNFSSYYSQAFNLTCYNSDGSDVDSEPDIATSATTCYLDSEEVCTIVAGYDQCQFDYDGNLPVPLPTNIVLGPEAVYVLPDEIKYYITSEDFSCTEENKGCTELGEPTFSQDKTMVDSFTSVYLLNQPDAYDDTLCSNSELFCAEWASTEDGNFYFKDPGDKSCEYKTGVSINNVSYDGWFRKGTAQFCYGVGTCSESGDFCTQDADCKNTGETCLVGEGSVCSVSLDSCASDSDCGCTRASCPNGACEATSGSYLIGGDFSGLWFNGDEEYGGWAGECKDQYDLCSEFIDSLDTKEGNSLEGQSYFYLDNSQLDEEDLPSADRCNNQVSLQEGCVLFNDSMDTELGYSSSPSYLLSEHADIFFGEDPRSLQDPVSCDEFSDGIFTTTTGSAVNVCQQRCVYDVSSGYDITNLLTMVGPTESSLGITKYFGAACVYDSDCQLATDSIGNTIEGICFNLDTDGDDLVGAEELIFDIDDDGVFDSGTDTQTDLSSYVSVNDSNRVLKVYRDRECAEWLTCSSSYAAWDDSQNKWVDVCEELGLCDSYDVGGDGGAFCNSWIKEDPVILSTGRYSGRDVSWYGLDYSGFSIPFTLPIETLEQFNIAPEGYCAIDSDTFSSALSCSSDSDCEDYSYSSCIALDELDPEALREQGLNSSGGDYYLVYNAASCDKSSGSSCVVGYCTDSGNPCSSSDDCANGACIIGQCVTVDNDSVCSSDDDCTTGTYTTCTGGECVDEGGNCLSAADCTDPVDSDSTTVTECQPGALAKTGTCYNGSCLVGINGSAFTVDNGKQKSCRGYPEVDAPFPLQVVQDWIDPTDLAAATPDDVLKNWSLSADYSKITDSLDSSEYDVIPYNYTDGFEDANVCSPVISSDDTSYYLFNDCDCSYEKVEYGNGLAKKYYPTGTNTSGGVPQGVCSGGAAPGSACANDADCSSFVSGEGDILSNTGTCNFITRKDSLNGWPGYCLENDSSTQIYGSSDPDFRACLTWLPVDQLRGSRDMYANDLDAGFGLNDSYYYCTELDVYADLYPTGAEFDSDGNVDEIGYGCADAAFNEGCDYPGGDSWDTGYSDETGDTSCDENVYCPPGYFALLGFCDQDDTDKSEEDNLTGDCDGGDFETQCGGIVPLCSDGGDDGSDVTEMYPDSFKDDYDDCPFFCIPEDSLHMEGTDSGESCETDAGEIGDGTATSKFNTRIYFAGNLFDSDDWDGQSDHDKFKDCVHRGVPIGEYSLGLGTSPPKDSDISGVFNGYVYAVDSDIVGSAGVSFKPIGDGIGQCSETGEVCLGTLGCQSLTNNKCESNYCTITSDYCDDDTPCPTSQDCDGTVSDRGSYAPYLGCYELAEVSNTTSGNKAWTNRLWSAAAEIYDTTEVDGFSRPFIYSALSSPVTAGRALYEEYFFSGVMKDDFASDSWPLPAASCKDAYNSLYTYSPGGCTSEYQYPLSAQYDGAGSSFGGYPWALAAPYEEVNTPDYDDALAGSGKPGGDFGTSSDSNKLSINKLLQQFFARVFTTYKYDWDYGGISSTSGGGAYISSGLSISDSDFSDDISNVGDSFYDVTGAFDGEPVPPKVISLGKCYNSECLEGDEGKFSVNGVDNGTMEFSGGSAHIILNFFAWADSDQMPIRDVTIDWGNADHVGSDMEWPIDATSQTGTRGDNSSYYKNRRGLEAEDKYICSGDDSENEWGLQPDACKTAYFSFETDYLCTKNMVDNTEILPACELSDDDGPTRLLNSPCADRNSILGIDSGKCVFQPRVHVKDNWGWCTGYCNTTRGEDGGSSATGCYEGDYNECDTNLCPGDKVTTCPDQWGGIDNPWINFDGYIVVDWQN